MFFYFPFCYFIPKLFFFDIGQFSSITTHGPFFRPLRNAIFKRNFFVQKRWYKMKPGIHLLVLLYIYWYLSKFSGLVVQFSPKLLWGKLVQARSNFCPLRNTHTSGEKLYNILINFHENFVRTRNKWLLSTTKNLIWFLYVMIFIWP